MLSPIMQAKAEEQAMLFDQEVAHLEADRRVAEVLDMLCICAHVTSSCYQANLCCSAVVCCLECVCVTHAIGH